MRPARRRCQSPLRRGLPEQEADRRLQPPRRRAAVSAAVTVAHRPDAAEIGERDQQRHLGLEQAQSPHRVGDARCRREPRSRARAERVERASGSTPRASRRGARDRGERGPADRASRRSMPREQVDAADPSAARRASAEPSAASRALAPHESASCGCRRDRHGHAHAAPR